MLRALIVDDHPLFRTALHEVVGTISNNIEIFQASTLDEARAVVGEHAEDDFDLILLDLQIPGSEGFSGLIALRNDAPSVPIIVVSASADSEVIQNVITYGAAGFVPKSFSKREIAEGISRVLAGDVFLPAEAACGSPVRAARQGGGTSGDHGLSALTRAEFRVLGLLADGKPNKIIAHELGIKESTVKAHITAILRKLKVHSRIQAVLMARHGTFTQR